ncbi:MAG: hypothetical protein MJZ67_00855 [Bacteroidales bacterium]|nr:hypothetical protein [Bacteroidales bacterium]
MKKIVFILTLVVIGNAISAQSLNVSSAREAQNRGYFDKAKKLIDAACVHEQTMNDAKTWYYAALIYSQIGAEAEKPKSKYKNLDPDWLTKSKDAAMRCKELDTEKEHVEGNTAILSFLGNEYYKQAINAWNDRNWESCIALCDESIKMFNESAKKEYASASYLLAGRAAMNVKNDDLTKRYFNTLVRSKSKENLVYSTLFKMYKKEGDTNSAIKVAQNYVKNCPEDFNANMMMAEAYMIKGNVEKGNEEIMKAMEKTKNNAQIHAGIQAAAGAAYEEVQDFTNAEKMYKESIATVPNQFLANYGLGKMLFNRAVDKINADVPLDDETGLYDKYQEEAKEFFRQSIPYFNSAISFIEAMDEDTQGQNRSNYAACLNALKTVYARLEAYDELKPINAKLDALYATQK